MCFNNTGDEWSNRSNTSMSRSKITFLALQFIPFLDKPGPWGWETDFFWLMKYCRAKNPPVS